MVTTDVGTATIGCPRSEAPPGVARGGAFNPAVSRLTNSSIAGVSITLELGKKTRVGRN
jgi:hypothetical protein